MRNLPAPRELLLSQLRSIEQRLRRIEQGGTLKGTPSVAELRIGDLLLSVDTTASPTLSLVAKNLLTGTTSTIITLT